MSDAVDILNAVKYVNMLQNLPSLLLNKTTQNSGKIKEGRFGHKWVEPGKYGFYSCNFLYKTRYQWL